MPQIPADPENSLRTPKPIRTGMVGLGMIFDETYRAVFEQRPDLVQLAAVASRTGNRAERYRQSAPKWTADFESFVGASSGEELAESDNVEVICIATPDDRHFPTAKAALNSGKHVLIEKPSVLSLAELDELQALADRNGVLAKVVYHKLFDPDHKKLRTHVADGVLQHVNNGYCSLLEPKSISTGQFAEWIEGRNPGTYVAVHYVKLIDFTFPNLRLRRITANGQRGIVESRHPPFPAPARPTWDSVQLHIVYAYPDGREAAFDIHTDWVTPENFSGYVEQEVQFRFDNGIWLGHQRKRGVEWTVEGRTPNEFKPTPNHHYSCEFLEPWNEKKRRGYGLEAIARFFEEVRELEFGGPITDRPARFARLRNLNHNDLSADRNVVAMIQSLEALLLAQVAGHPGSVVKVNEPNGGLVLFKPGVADGEVLYSARV